MNVTLDENDRVIVRYEVPDFKDRITSQLIIVEESTGDAYSMLFGRIAFGADTDETFELQWRGKLSDILKRFADEVDTFEHDYKLEQA